MFETRKNEHEAKVRLTKKDIEDGNIESAEVRMGEEDGEIARHRTIRINYYSYDRTQCSKDKDWKKLVYCKREGI